MTRSRASAGSNRALAWARRLLLWGPVLAWMVAIFLLSARPDDNADPGGGVSGVLIPKVAHVIEYAILGFLLARAMDLGLGRASLGSFVVLVTLYAVSDELHQMFVPGRTPLAVDVALDLSGGLLGAAVRYRQQAPIRLARSSPAPKGPISVGDPVHRA